MHEIGLRIVGYSRPIDMDVAHVTLSAAASVEPSLDEARRTPAAGLVLAFAAAAAIAFLCARSIAMGEVVALTDLDLLAAGILPVASVFLLVHALRQRCRPILAGFAPVVAGAWILSLCAYVLLHELRRFDGLESLVRATVTPGVGRYVIYGLIYSTVGYAIALAIHRLWRGASVRGPRAAALAVAFAFNVVYFGVVLFVVPFASLSS